MMIRAAIFSSQDASATTSKIVTGAASNIALNVPAGGCWRDITALGYQRPADVPSLGQLPSPTVAA